MDKKDLPVAGLVRVSTLSQAEDHRAGLARQRDVIRRTIENRGLRCVKEIELTDVSGTNVRNCPEIQELLDDVQWGRLTGVVVADLDRLVRPADIEDLALLQVFQDTGAILYCGDQEIDLSSDSGYLMGGIQALLAGHELRLIKKRMMGGKEAKRRQGKHPNGDQTLPLGVGYDRQSEKFFYNDNISVVQEAFRLLDDGECADIAAVAKRLGCVTPRGLKCILRNKTYIGVREYTKKAGPRYRSGDGRQRGRRKIPREKHEIISRQVIDEPAVPPDRFERVQALLDAKRGVWSSARAAGRVHLGTGILRCGYCGATLNCKAGTWRKGKYKRGYYVCKYNDSYWRRKGRSCEQSAVPEDEIESLLISLVSHHLSDTQFLTALAENYIESQQEQASRAASVRASMKARITKLKSKLQRMEELYYAGGFENAGDYIAKRAEASIELEDLLATSPPSSVPTLEDMQPVLERILRGALSFPRVMDRAEQRRVIEGMLAEVTVVDGQITGFVLTPPFLGRIGCVGRHPQGMDS